MNRLIITTVLFEYGGRAHDIRTSATLSAECARLILLRVLFAWENSNEICKLLNYESSSYKYNDLGDKSSALIDIEELRLVTRKTIF